MSTRQEPHRVRARVATTHLIPAYGGIRLSKSTLAQMADALNSGSVPMHFNHDLDQPIAVTNVEAGLEQLDDGETACWVEFDVGEADWESVTAQVAEAGAPGGFSFTTMERIEGPEDGSDLEVGADAHYYSDDEIRRATSALSENYSVRIDRVFQFSAIPEAAVFITFSLQVVQQIPANLLADLLLDLGRRFLRPDRRSIFNVSVRKSERKMVAKIRIVADDEASFVAAVKKAPAVLREALASEEET